jgi:hypothetical protein
MSEDARMQDAFRQLEREKINASCCRRPGFWLKFAVDMVDMVDVVDGGKQREPSPLAPRP